MKNRIEQIKKLLKINKIMNTVQNEKDIKRMIEVILSFEDDFSQRKERYRFEMSGYENVTGDVTIYNQLVLNKFAHLGIYDYTRFLFLDCKVRCN